MRGINQRSLQILNLKSKDSGAAQTHKFTMLHTHIRIQNALLEYTPHLCTREDERMTRELEYSELDYLELEYFELDYFKLEYWIGWKGSVRALTCSSNAPMQAFPTPDIILAIKREVPLASRCGDMSAVVRREEDADERQEQHGSDCPPYVPVRQEELAGRRLKPAERMGGRLRDVDIEWCKQSKEKVPMNRTNHTQTARNYYAAEGWFLRKNRRLLSRNRENSKEQRRRLLSRNMAILHLRREQCLVSQWVWVTWHQHRLSEWKACSRENQRILSSKAHFNFGESTDSTLCAFCHTFALGSCHLSKGRRLNMRTQPLAGAHRMLFDNRRTSHCWWPGWSEKKQTIRKGGPHGVFSGVEIHAVWAQMAQKRRCQ